MDKTYEKEVFVKVRNNRKGYGNFSINLPTGIAKELGLRNKDKIRIFYQLDPDNVAIILSFGKISKKKYKAILSSRKKEKSSKDILLLREYDKLSEEIKKYSFSIKKLKKRKVKDFSIKYAIEWQEEALKNSKKRLKEIEPRARKVSS